MPQVGHLSKPAICEKVADPATGLTTDPFATPGCAPNLPDKAGSMPTTPGRQPDPDGSLRIGGFARVADPVDRPAAASELLLETVGGRFVKPAGFEPFGEM